MNTQRNAALEAGFTLIETIVFMVLLGLFGSFLFSYVQTTTESSVVAASWLQEENQLQNMMEDIVAEYKELLTENSVDAVSGTDDLETLKAYAENEYKSFILGSETGYIYFDSDGDSTWPPQGTIQAQDPVLIITIRVGEQSASSMFMATE